MLDYAIVRIDSKQYKIELGQEYLVDFAGTEAKTIEAEVLLKSEDGKVTVGTPVVESMTLQVLGHKRGKKIRVAKFHPKANYRRANGHREIKTRVQIV